MRGLFTAVAFMATAASAQTAPAIPETSFIYQERGWQLYVDHTIDDGCYVVKMTPSITVRVQHDPQSSRVYVILLSHRWKSLDDGKHYPLSFNFDRNPTWDVEARAMHIGGTPGLSFWVNDIEFINEFMSSHSVSFFTGRSAVGTFDLAGSARALDMLATCKDEMEKSKDPFAGGAPPSPPPPVYIPPPVPSDDDPFDT